MVKRPLTSYRIRKCSPDFSIVTTSVRNHQERTKHPQVVEAWLERRRRRTHETGGEFGVGPDLVVDLDEALGDDELDLSTGQSVLQSVLEQDLYGRGPAVSQLATGIGRYIFFESETYGEGQAFTELVRTGVGPDGISTAELVEHP